ncbi:MAG TPA: RNA polymerase sigma factor [Myxococcota bacterium]|jgi:RNA polymerase sigma factor (sigma-70 family)
MRQPFEEIVAEHGPAVMRVCRALLGAFDAQDAWSETFMAALKAYPRLRADSNVRGWLVTIAQRKAIDQLRTAARAPVASDVLPELAGASDAPTQSDRALRSALDTLPPMQRGAVIHRYLGDLPYADVALLLGCSEAAARRNAADGLANLRARIRKEHR